MNHQPGRFIVFEGLDGAGTTTQSRMLAERLQHKGRTVHLAHQPSDGHVGQLIRQILAGRAATAQADGKLGVVDERVMALLFAADRLDHLGSQIEPHLARGEDVILDRYIRASALIIQGAGDRLVRVGACPRAGRLPPRLAARGAGRSWPRSPAGGARAVPRAFACSKQMRPA